jgi:membrane-anchored protein YejM (alkaline phosphatase superfamily)
VVITGDHGEEFMEQGHWGHNSAFSEAQIRVPLVLHVPGRAAGVVDRLTSHLDLPATLLGALGASSPASDYSLGQSLLGDTKRSDALVSDWNHVAYVDAEGKFVFPTTAAGFGQREVRDRQDVALAEPGRYMSEHAARFAQVWRDISRFSVRGGRPLP